MIGKRQVPSVYASGIVSCTKFPSHRKALLHTPHLRMPSTPPKSLSRLPSKVGLMRVLKRVPIHVMVMKMMIKRDTNAT